MKKNLPTVLEAIGAGAVLLALGVTVDPWIAVGAGGVLAMVAGYVIEAQK